MSAKIQGAQRNFSSGEIDSSLKRSDEHPARKTGLRQMANMRVLNSGAIQDRSGRTALFPLSSGNFRIEEVAMSVGNTFKLMFGFDPQTGRGTLGVFNSVGLSVFSTELQGNGAALPWNLSNIQQIIYAQLGLSIYITFGGMRPQVLSWDGVSTWSVADYNETIIGSQKRTPFYRLTAQGITLLPAAQTGSGINVTASAAIFTAAHVGTRLRYVNRQMLITSIVGPPPSTQCLVTIEEPLPGSQSLTFGTDPTPFFAVGDVVRGSVTGSAGLVVSVTSSPAAITVQLISTNAATVQTVFPLGQPTTDVFAFTTSDTVVGPGGGLTPSGGVTAIQAPRTVSYWDEEVMNAFRGYPASCFVDQFRLGFCDFPAIPNGIAWSAINSPTDLYVVGTTPSSAMFELAPDKVRVNYVVPGPESSEFVFCDHKVYYIKIDPQNPLKSGSVSFQNLSSDGAARVQPRVSQEVILYVNSGGNSVMAVIAPGSYYRPFNTKNLCEFHSHLFNNIQALAAPNADGTFNERYLYALNGDGSLTCGRYEVSDGKISEVMGWGPWSGGASVSWIAATNADVIFTSTYFGKPVCEILDDTQYLDAAVSVNNLPAPFFTAGKGPLFWIAGQTVSLMDQATRPMGIYQIDGNGFIIPQGNAGENLTAATLVAGQSWTSIVEPFCPDANPGQDVHQRMFKRRVARFAVYVAQSTGFMMGRLFAGPLTPTSPPLGTLMNFRRFPAFNQDDDPTKPPPLRETTERIRPLGRAFDPRVAIIKDVPGPLRVLEIGVECTI